MESNVLLWNLLNRVVFIRLSVSYYVICELGRRGKLGTIFAVSPLRPRINVLRKPREISLAGYRADHWNSGFNGHIYVRIEREVRDRGVPTIVIRSNSAVFLNAEGVVRVRYVNRIFR